jgi:hypothetical protein
MYKRSGKFIDQLLLYYEVARDLWVSIFRLFGVECIMPRRVVELLVSWRGQLESCCKLEAWKIAPIYLIWCI